MCCSIYCLPDDVERRAELLRLALDHKVELHFANELCSLRSEADLEHIQKVFEFVNENTAPNKTLGYDK